MMPKSNIPMPPPNSGAPAMGGGGAPGEGGGMPDLSPDQAKELITKAAEKLKILGDKYNVDVIAIMQGAGGQQPQPEQPLQQ